MKKLYKYSNEISNCLYCYNKSYSYTDAFKSNSGSQYFDIDTKPSTIVWHYTNVKTSYMFIGLLK